MDVTLFLLQIGVMLATALLFGQLMRRFGQPAVMGELIGGVALSITALPVIARILGDLGLMQDELGAVVMSAAIVNDLIGWALFAVILGSFAPQSAAAAGRPGVTLALAAAFTLLVVLGGRVLGPQAFHWIRRRRLSTSLQSASLRLCISWRSGLESTLRLGSTCGSSSQSWPSPASARLRAPARGRGWAAWPRGGRWPWALA